MRKFLLLLSGLLVNVGSPLHQNRKYVMVTIHHSNCQGVLAVAAAARRVCPLVVNGQTGRVVSSDYVR